MNGTMNDSGPEAQSPTASPEEFLQRLLTVDQWNQFNQLVYQRNREEEAAERVNREQAKHESNQAASTLGAQEQSEAEYLWREAKHERSMLEERLTRVYLEVFTASVNNGDQAATARNSAVLAMTQLREYFATQLD